MTDRLTAGQVGTMLRGLLDKLDDRASPRDLLRCLVAMFEIEAARREAEYERPKPTPGVKFYCSAVPERTSCWGSNCPPDGCGYPVDARREAEGQKHDLYETGDTDAPDAVKDQNGEVVLGLCRRCGRGEVDLAEPCDAPPPSAPLNLVKGFDDPETDKAFDAALRRIADDERTKLGAEVEALRAERDAALAYIKSWEAEFNWMTRAEAAEADAKRLREVLEKIAAYSDDATDPKLSPSDSFGNGDDVFRDGMRQSDFYTAQIARNALAQGGTNA